MKRILFAFVIAVAVHVLLAALFGWFLALDRNCVAVAPELDLSSVELSLSEKPVDSAPVQQAALPPSPPPTQEAPKPKTEKPEVKELPPLVEVPPEMASVELPQPQELESDIRPPEEAAEPEAQPTPEAAPEREAAPAQESAPPQEAPDQARVEVDPTLKRGFDMKRIYPRESRLRGEEGDVRLEFSITPEGTVASVTLVTSSGYPALDAAALKAARKATFTPGQDAQGNAVSSVARLTLTFRLR